jgi:hypothetical protein
MKKMKSWKVLTIIWVVLLIIPLVLTQLPISKAQTFINAGLYNVGGPSTGYNNVHVTWNVETPYGIDVFLFTSAQCTSWIASLPADPTSAIQAHYNTSLGDFEQSISKSTVYYVIFSNVKNPSDALVTLDYTWSNTIAGFEFLMVFIGILTLIGIVFSLRERSKPNFSGL